VPADLIGRLNRYVTGAFARARLDSAGAHLSLNTPPGDEFDAVLTPVVRAAVDLLTSKTAGRLGICADSTCAWVFLDTTRGRTRRWCDMKACGNRNKVRRFRHAAAPR
jgi:predicted RNA-binding Zn ribbon-like protein